MKIWYFLGFLPFWLNFGLFLGLLLVMPGEQIEGDMVYDIAKVAALLHRAAVGHSAHFLKIWYFFVFFAISAKFWPFSRFVTGHAW